MQSVPRREAERIDEAVGPGSQVPGNGPDGGDHGFMLDSRYKHDYDASPASRIDIAETSEMVLRETLRILRRRSGLILAILLCCALAGFAYVLIATRTYTATVELLVGSNRLNLAADVGGMANPLSTAENLIESQVEILQSEAIANRVVEKLDLVSDPDFNGSSPGRWTRYFNNALRTLAPVVPASWKLEQWRVEVTHPRVTPTDTLRRIAASTLLTNTKVSRVARTSVIDLSFTALDPEKAAKIANAFADAYLVDQLEVQYEQSRRATAWLAQRLDEMKASVENAEKLVETYRAEHNLTVANGQLISDQQLQELNAQLTGARARLAEARAKFEQVRAFDLAGSDPAALPEVMTSEAIVRLKTQYSEISRSIAELSNKFGPAHPQVVSAMAQLESIQALIKQEMAHVVSSYKNELDVAQARVQSLQTSLNELTSRNAGQSQSQINLRELERDASSSRAIYERFLNRYKEMNGNETLPVPDARILATAAVPGAPSQPQVPLILGLSLVGGLAAGLGLAFGIEYLQSGLRTRKQVEDTFQLPFLALVPLVRGVRQKSLVNYACENPLTRYAEAIRSIRMAIHFASNTSPVKVVAVASALPAEGKSTTSLNLARYAAEGGARTLLVDADMRRPTITKLVSPHADRGLAEVLRGRASLQDCLIPDEYSSSLTFLPCTRNAETQYTAELLASEQMQQLLNKCRTQFDLIILDVSPIVPVVDARALLNAVDKIILVAEWNKTSRFVVKEALQLIEAWRDNILGIALNKCDMKRVHQYEYYNSKAYANRYPDYYGTRK